jgi:fructose-specific phosphotransferase system IIA component
MRLTDILSEECVLVPLDAKDKSDAIRQLVNVLAREGLCADETAVANAVLEREAIRTTGIGRGLAVPHGKSDRCPQMVMAIGKPRTPLDFDSIDGQPADLVALIASPADQTGPHIQALARISRMMLTEAFRDAIRQAQDSAAIYKVVQEADESA